MSNDNDRILSHIKMRNERIEVGWRSERKTEREEKKVKQENYIFISFRLIIIQHVFPHHRLSDDGYTISSPHVQPI